jgi:Zn-dependent M16 (insulinase) family peptidase
MVRYLIGESDEERQQYREQVLSTTVKDFKAFADVLKTVSDKALVVVLGSQEAIEEANEVKNGWLEVQKVL